MLNDYLSVARPYLEHYGYLAVFVGVLLDNFGVPAPGETLLVAGAVLASQGAMGLFVFPVAWAAAALGDNLAFALGHFGGRQVVLRYGPRVGISASRLARAERFFLRYGAVIVTFARFFEVLRQLNGIAAGIGRMPWWSFFGWNALGAALWVGVWGGGAYLLGAHLDAVLVVIERFAPYVIAATALVALALVIRAVRRRGG